MSPISGSKIPADTETISINGVAFSHGDLFKVVDDFYTRVQNDPVLRVPFHSVHDWPDHIRRLTHFWWIRFGGKAYMLSQYNPVVKHFFAGFNGELLERWLSIFHQTLKDRLSPEQAELWAVISERMGHALSLKNDFYRQHHKDG